MLRRVLIVGLLVGAVGTVTIAAAPSATPSPRMGKWRLAHTPLGRLISGNVGRLLVLRSELNATEEQRAKIREILVSHKTEIAKTAKAVRDRRVALREAVMADGTDDAKIRQAADDLGEVIGDAAVKAKELRGEIAPILTDEQRELIEECRMDCDGAVDNFFAKVLQGE